MRWGTRDKHFLAKSAEGAYPGIGKLLKGRAGGDPAIGGSQHWVIDIATGFTYIFFCIHSDTSLHVREGFYTLLEYLSQDVTDCSVPAILWLLFTAFFC